MNKITKFAAVFFVIVRLSFSNYAAVEPSFRFIDIGHARLNVAEWMPSTMGGDLILALPGSGGDYSRYKSIAPLLAEAGYHVIVINQRGVMGSTGNLEGLTLKDLAYDVIAVADSLDAKNST